ncbi:hypothetical protein OVX87_31700 [Klebsiella pneumoniae]|nr:hypothetical protein [Klebsiella pneumoniae]
MQRLNVRNIPDEIYRQFEQEAARQERSTEAHARFVIAQSVQREAALTGADRYRRELSARLRHLLPWSTKRPPAPAPITSRRWTRPPWRSASVRPTHWR